jgi:hypothetical protein
VRLLVVVKNEEDEQWVREELEVGEMPKGLDIRLIRRDPKRVWEEVTRGVTGEANR